MRVPDRKDLLKVKRVATYSAISLLLVLAVFLIPHFKKSRGVYYELEDFAMGTRIRVVLASEEVSPKSLAENVMAEFRRLDAKLNPYREGSTVYELNHSSGWVELDEETFSLIEAALGYCRATDGAFDPTLGRVLSLWGFSEFSKGSFRVPSDDELKKALSMSGCDKVELMPEKRMVKLNGVWLDLGGIAKGYALERAYAIVKKLDPNATGFIDAGGEIKIVGPKYGSYPWVIGIRNPRGSGAIDYIYLKEGAVATSGDYERYFEEGGVRYHHILDPKTGRPARGARSITVIADDAVKADVYSTAGFVMAKDWRYVLTRFEELGMQVFMVLDDGKVVKSRGFEVFEVKR